MKTRCASASRIRSICRSSPSRRCRKSESRVPAASKLRFTTQAHGSMCARRKSSCSAAASDNDAASRRPFPADHRRRTEPEQLGDRVTAPAPRNRRNNTFTQILRIGLRHPYWPPPSQQVESDHAPRRNPSRFYQCQKGSSATAVAFDRKNLFCQCRCFTHGE